MTLDIIKKINKLAKKINREIVIMELCGTHTEAVAKNGIKKILPKNIKLLSGPGCPVCVTDQKDIDAIIVLALNGVPVACYGDVLRVPGNLTVGNWKLNYKNIIIKDNSSPLPKGEGQGEGEVLSLNKARELGADVTEVYSVEDALRLQKKKPDLVFFGLGFETTTPMTADAIKRGLTVYSSHKVFVPAMQAIINTPTLKIDGFLNPGHVSTIIGVEQYKNLKFRNPHPSPLPEGEGVKNPCLDLGRVRGGIPQVIAGFEAEDVLIGIYMILKQISENKAEVENEYTRAVHQEGNSIARKLIDEVFEIEDAFWRGLGNIPGSGLKIRDKYSEFDAKVKYKEILLNSYSEWSDSEMKNPETTTQGTKLRDSDISKQCLCGAILRGLKQPKDCKLFNKKCTPENPVGACMVSSEGACGIEAKYLG
ncbi:MAG: hydrogenase formation protein HypD [Candidatus Pacebacteria bacterium]|nr:hydrogenase formation protein HypD [Candidatus Paceibacterota bacterium]